MLSLPCSLNFSFLLEWQISDKNIFPICRSQLEKMAEIQAMPTQMAWGEWGCAAGTLEPLAFTRASSSEFCYPLLECTRVNSPNPPILE